MMKNSRLGEGETIESNIIKDARNLFRQQKEIDRSAIKGIKNLSRLNKENKAIKDRVIRYIRNLLGKRLLQTI